MGTQVYKNKQNKRVRSVTTIINHNLGWNKPALMGWQYRELKAGRDTRNITDKAKSIGNLCHEMVRCDDLGIEISKKELEKYSIEAIETAEFGREQWQKIKRKYGIIIKNTEVPLMSEKYQYGGTYDFDADISLESYIQILKNYIKDVNVGEYINIDTSSKYNGICVLGDYKTSKNIYLDHIIQLSAYKTLYACENNIYPNANLIVHIDKDPTIDQENIIKLYPVKIENDINGWEVFKSLLEIDKLYKKMQNKKEKK